MVVSARDSPAVPDGLVDGLVDRLVDVATGSVVFVVTESALDATESARDVSEVMTEWSSPVADVIPGIGEGTGNVPAMRNAPDKSGDVMTFRT